MNGTDQEFLLAKAELFGTAAQSREAGVTLAQSVQKWLSKGDNSRARASSIDRDIEELFSPAEQVGKLAEARKQLRDRFGFDRLGTDPKTVIARVLKRGRIRNDPEMAVVRDFVSNQGNEEAIGTESYERLARILDEAEA